MSQTPCSILNKISIDFFYLFICTFYPNANSSHSEFDRVPIWILFVSSTGVWRNNAYDSSIFPNRIPEEITIVFWKKNGIPGKPSTIFWEYSQNDSGTFLNRILWESSTGSQQYSHQYSKSIINKIAIESSRSFQDSFHKDSEKKSAFSERNLNRILDES